jgi:hypothetical protein
MYETGAELKVSIVYSVWLAKCYMPFCWHLPEQLSLENKKKNIDGLLRVDYGRPATAQLIEQ